MSKVYQQQIRQREKIKDERDMSMFNISSFGQRYNYKQYSQTSNAPASKQQIQAAKDNVASNYSDKITPTDVDLGETAVKVEYTQPATTSSTTNKGIFSSAYNYITGSGDNSLYHDSGAKWVVDTVSSGVSSAYKAVTGLFNGNKTATKTTPAATTPAPSENFFSTGTIVAAGTAAAANPSSSGIGAAVGMVTGETLKETVAGNTITTLSTVANPATAAIFDVAKGIYDYATGKNNQSLVQNVVNNVKSTVTTVAKTIASPIAFTARTISSINSFGSAFRAVGTLIAAPFKTIGQGIGNIISAISSIFTGGKSSSGKTTTTPSASVSMGSGSMGGSSSSSSSASASDSADSDSGFSSGSSGPDNAFAMSAKAKFNRENLA